MPFPHFHRTAGGGQVDFSSPNIRRSVLAVTAPMLVAQLLNLSYNIVDRIYISKIPGQGTLALSDGGSPVISYNYGARMVGRVRAAIRFMTQLGFGYTLLIWALISLFLAAFIRTFNQDPELLAAAMPALQIYFFGFFMMAFQFSGQSVFKSLNKAKLAIFFSLLRKAIIVVPLTLLLPHVAGLGMKGVFLAEPVSNFVGGLACYITMRLTVMPELSAMERAKSAR